MPDEDKNILVLDHIENIVIHHDKMKIRNYQAIFYNKTGLYTLAKNVRDREIGVRLNPFNIKYGVTGMFNMNSPEFEMITSMFNWYSTSIVSYIQLISLLKIAQQKNWSLDDIAKGKNKKYIHDDAKEYLNRLIPDIYTWRHKVSAHYAAYDPFRNDNIATLEQSLFPNVMYHSPYFYVAKVNYKSGEEISDLNEWSLTKNYHS